MGMRSNTELDNLVLQYDREKKPEIKNILVKENTFPWKAKIGMIVGCYTDHLPYMKYTLNQYRKVDDMYIIGAFDSRKIAPTSPKEHFPPNDIMYLAHSWVFKHHTWGGHAKRHGWLWSQIYASSILRTFDNIKYVVLANGDCVWDKPQGIYDVIDLLGDDHFMSGQSFTRHTDGFSFIHSCSVVFSAIGYFDFIDFVIDKMKKEKTTESFSPESLIQQWTRKNTYSWKHAPIQPSYPNGDHDMYCETNSDSTWKRLLGFRNLEAENRYRRYNDLEPLNEKYFNMSQMKWYKDIDRNCLLKYYKTRDRKYLEEWWRYKKF